MITASDVADALDPIELAHAAAVSLDLKDIVVAMLMLHDSDESDGVKRTRWIKLTNHARDVLSKATPR